MIQIKIEGLETIKRRASGLARQVTFAASLALNRLALDVRDAARKSMLEVFDRPTPWTLRNLDVLERATKRELSAVVGMRHGLYSKTAVSPGELLAHQFAGGARAHKRLEAWLMRAGYLVAGEYVAPGAGARLDAYGNMNRGQIAQIMSQMRLGADATAWKSGSRRSKAAVRRAGRIFWSRGGRLKRGAWIETARGVVKPLLVVVRRPAYRRRVDLEAIVRPVVAERFAARFSQAFAEAMETAR